MFNFGTNKSSSQSSSYGYNSSFSDSLSQAQSQQRIAFEDIFRELYTGASGAAGKAAEMLPLFQGQAADLYSSGVGFLDKLGVGAGEDYLQSRLTSTETRDQQLGALKTGLGELFRDEINPAITSRAVAGGTLGGGRQGVAQGVAAGKLGTAYTKGAADIFASDQAAKDAAAGTLISGRNTAAGIGLSSLPSLFSVAEGGLNAASLPYATLAGILGGPTVLGSSSEVAAALSRAFGEDFSSSSSKGKGFSFGI